MHIIPLAQSLDAMLEIQLAANQDQECLFSFGGDIALTDTSVKLQYRMLPVDLQTSMSANQGAWINLKSYELDLLPVTPEAWFIQLDSSSVGVQVRLLQLEHGGGSCNCWSVKMLNLSLNSSETDLLSFEPCSSRDLVGGSSNFSFCDGSASNERGMISRAIMYLPGEEDEESCPAGSSTELISAKDKEDLPFSLNMDCSTASARL